jgi:hypothetical protein
MSRHIDDVVVDLVERTSDDTVRGGSHSSEGRAEA